MNVKDQLNNAIASHGLWKNRLRTAIDKGNSEFTVDNVTADRNCEFGRWLYGSPEIRRSPSYEKVRDLHAVFHKEVGRILGMALAGKKDQAKEALANRQTFRPDVGESDPGGGGLAEFGVASALDHLMSVRGVSRRSFLSMKLKKLSLPPIFMQRKYF